MIIGGSLSAISLYFRKWSSLATGFMLAGAGVGVVAIGLEVEWAVETFGWRGTMLIQAGLAFQICVFAVLVRGLPSSPESNAKPECAVGNNEIPSISKAVNTNGMPLSKSNVIDTNKVSFKALLKNSVFWLSVVTFLSIQFTISTILTILKGFMINIQLPGSFKLIISLMGAGSILGRLIAGPLSNRICPPLLMSIVGILYCVSSILIVFSKVEWAIASSVFAYGVFQGNVVVSSVVTMSWAFGKTKMPFVRGYIMFFGVISSLSGAPLIGKAF